jgi:uncharacterized RDD family membrane protein YckC
MKRHPLSLLLGAVAAIALLGAGVLRSEDTPPPPPAPATTSPASPAPPVQPAAAEPAPVQTEAAPAVVPAAPEAAPTPTAEPPATGLRRLDAENPAPAHEATAGAPAPEHALRKHHGGMASGDNAKVSIGHNAVVAADENVQAAVSIAGSTTVDGHTSDAAVSILGSTTVNGSVGNAAVSVFGNTTVNGPVGDAAVAVLGDTRVNAPVDGDVVAVMGNVDLGPKARVRGQVVVVGGVLHRDPAAEVRGGVQSVSIGERFPGFGWLYAWVTSALLKGRLLSFAYGAGWAWLVAGAFLLLYALIALIFPRGVEKCAETLEQRPGFTVLATLLTIVAIPIVIVILLITGVGVLVVPFLGIGLAAAKLFGRVAMLAWIGRRFTGLVGQGRFVHAAVAVIVGGVLVNLLYLVPVVAFLVHGLIGLLGLGMVVYALILSMRKNGAKPAPAGSPAPVPAAPAAGMAFAAGGTEAAPAPVAPPALPGASAVPVPPVISAVTLPRAGFWIRLLALGIDLILVCLVIKILPWVHFSWRLCGFLLAVYGVVMWKLRGTTVGGSIFHLKVVRLDDRPLDWTAAVVRVLGCMISLVVIGLGFLWVAFDDEKQSWHDKIAGTTVVRVPRGVSLI